MRSADEWPQFALDKLTRSPTASNAFDKNISAAPILADTAMPSGPSPPTPNPTPTATAHRSVFTGSVSAQVLRSPCGNDATMSTSGSWCCSQSRKRSAASRRWSNSVTERSPEFTASRIRSSVQHQVLEPENLCCPSFPASRQLATFGLNQRLLRGSVASSVEYNAAKYKSPFELRTWLSTCAGDKAQFQRRTSFRGSAWRPQNRCCCLPSTSPQLR
jgi:hypothetical protein